MTDWPTVEDLLDQESRLTLPSFTHDDAWRLGTALVEEARSRDAAVAMDITRNGQQLFHAALPGTAADNDQWLIRKSRVVMRFGHSSLYVGQLCRDRGQTIAEVFGLDPALYAAHGGGFPLHVTGAGVIGVVGVSGLPQLQDHALIVDVLGRFVARA